MDFALEGCTGWRYVAEEIDPAGLVAHVGEPADTAALRGRKRHAKTDRTDSRHLRQVLSDGRLPECWIPPTHILEDRALLELYRDLRVEHTAWTQWIHAVLFHQGAPRLSGEAGFRTVQGRAELAAITAEHLSPVGRVQVATALDMLKELDEHLDAIRRELLHAARHLKGARVLTERLYGVGSITTRTLCCWPAGTAALSGFAQSFGYLMATVGPLGMGWLNGVTGGWTVPLLVLTALCLPQLLVGLYAARPRYLEDELVPERTSGD